MFYTTVVHVRTDRPRPGARPRAGAQSTPPRPRGAAPRRRARRHWCWSWWPLLLELPLGALLPPLVALCGGQVAVRWPQLREQVLATCCGLAAAAGGAERAALVEAGITGPLAQACAEAARTLRELRIRIVPFM